MSEAAGGLFSKRGLNLRDRPAVILVQLLKSLGQRFEITGTGFVIFAIRIYPIQIELFLG